MSTDVYGVSSRRASGVPNWRSDLAISISRADRRASIVKHTSAKLMKAMKAMKAQDKKITRATEKSKKTAEDWKWVGKSVACKGDVRRCEENSHSKQQQVLNSFRREALAATVVFVPGPFWWMQSPRSWIVCWRISAELQSLKGILMDSFHILSIFFPYSFHILFIWGTCRNIRNSLICCFHPF